MLKTFINAKLHGLRVTQKSLRYHGSVAIDRDLLARAGIDQYEQVHVVNLNNGKRWVTYAIPADSGVFSLNGGGARCGEVGDECIVMTYIQAEKLLVPLVLEIGPDNRIVKGFRYAAERFPGGAPAVVTGTIGTFSRI